MNRNLNHSELIQKLETAEKRIAELEHDLARKNRLLDEYQLPMVLEDVETDQIIGVTGHKLVELSLRDNEARYRSLFENLPVAIWEEDFSAVKSYLEELRNRGVTDFDAYLTAHEEAIRECVELIKVTDVNQAALVMYEASSKAELLGSLSNTFPIDAVTGFKDEILMVAKGELGFRAQSLVWTFHGHQRSVIINWIVPPGYEQTYGKVLVTLSDVTDLRQAQEKYQEIFENSEEGLFQSSPEGRFLRVNPAMARIYGYGSPQEMIETITDIARQIYVQPGDREQFTALLASQDSVLNFEMQNCRKDRSIIWTSTSARTVRDENGMILYYEGFLQDITERKEAEEARNEAELRYRALFEQSHDAIFILDLVGRHLAVNQRAADMLGYTREELLSLSVHELSAEPAQSQQVLQRLLSGERIPIYERLFRKKNGSSIPVEINVELVHDTHGNPLHIQSVVRDITDRRRAEIELQHRNEDLGLINAINELIVRGGNLEAIVNLLAKELKRLFSSEGSTIYMLSPDERSLTMQQYFLPSHTARKIEKLIGSTIPFIQIPIQEGGYFQKVLNSGRGTITSDPEEIQDWMAEFAETSFLPPVARRAIRKLVSQIYKLLNIKSAITVPLLSSGKAIGLLDVSSSGLFTSDDLERIENIGRQLTAAILRQRDMERIERSEKFLESIQNALSASIAILDEQGRIVRVNAAWRKFGEQNGLTDAGYGIGTNYLDICDSATGSNAEEAPLVTRMVREVITGHRNEAWVEYPCHSPEEKRWFVLRITKFEDGDKIWVVLAHENITERRQAQDAIQRSAAILAQAGRMAHLGAWEIEVINPENLNENPLHWSDEVYRIFGYEPGGVELTVDLFYERVHPDDRQKVQEAIGQAIAGKKPYEVEHRIIRPDGVERILEERADLFYDQQGQLIQILGAVQDITERKRTEQALRETSEQLRTLFEASPEAIMLVDPHGDWPILDCNTTACSMNGYAREELIGESIDILTLVPGDSAGRAEYFEQVRTAGILRYEDFHRRKDGSIFPIEVSTSLVTLGGQEVILGIDRDITERKRAEETLRESEALYRQAIEVAGAVPYRESYDDDGRSIKYEFIGEGIRQITGYGPEEFSTELWDSLVEEVVLVEDLAGYSLDEGIQRVRAGDNPIWKCEHRIRARDGSIHWVFEAAVELRDEHGVSHGSIGMYQDITNRKHSEQALRESEKRYRALFEDMPIAIWEEDFSEAKAHLDSLRQQGVTDFRAYFASHPESLLECAHKVRILDVNNTAVEMYRARAKEQLLRNLEGDVSESELQQLQAVLISIAGGQLSLTWDGPDETFTGEQIEINLAASVSPGHEKDYSRIIFTTADITERKRAEEELRQSEKRYRTVVENQTEFIVRWRPDGVRTFANEAYSRYFALTPEQVLSTGFMSLIYEDDRPAVEGKISRLVSGITNVETEIHRVIKPDGGIGWQEWTDHGIYDKFGQVLEFQSVGRDITERKEAEEAVRESEAKYRDLYENNPLMLFTLATDGTVLEVNRAAVLQLEYDEAEMLGQPVVAVFHAEDHARLLKKFQEFIEHPIQTSPWEFRKITKSGKVIWVSETARLIPHKQGELAVLIVCEDITERKEAEHALRESEEKYRLLFESNPLPMWIYDLETLRFLKVNEAAINHYGYSAAEFMSITIKDIRPSKDVPKLLESIMQVTNGIDSAGVWEHVRKDGSSIQVDIISHPVQFNGRRAKLVLANDITERIRTEAELRASEERFRQLAEHIEEVFWITDAITNEEFYISPAAEKIWGRPIDNLVHSDVFLETVVAEDREAVQRILADQRSGKKTEMEYRIIHPDGSIRWIWDRAFPIFDDSGKVVRLAGIAAEITERKQVEEQLRQSETRYRLATRASNDVIWEWNAKTHELIWSENAQVVFGYFAEEIGPEEKWWDEHLHPEDLEHILSKLNGLLNGEGSIWSAEYRFLRKDGSYAHISDHAYIERDADGNPLRMIGAMSDITEQKQNESEINRHLAELEALYVNGLAVGRLLEPRAIGERMIQTFAQYLSWHHVTIRLCKDNSDELELIAFHLPHMAGGTTEREEQHFKTHVSRVGQGLSGWVVETGDPFRTSNLADDPHYVNTYEGMQSGLYMPLKVGDRVIGVISVESDEREAFSEQDERLLATLANQAATAFENARLYQASQQEIWDRRIAEDALRQSEENYRRLARELEVRVLDRTAEVQDLYDNAPCGYHSLDPDGRIIRVNQTELNWLGYAREEVLGHSLLEFITDESRAAFKGSFPAFKQQGSLRDFELEMLRKDGSIFPVLVSATAIYDKEGRYLTSRSTLFDDTDRKHAMETLRLANSEMKRAMRMKDEFLASMSHELRTPLNAILGLSESLLEQTAGPINEKQHKYLGTVNESGRHLLELINDILDLAKIESGQIKIDPGRVNINTACETSLRMIKQLAQKKNQTVEVEIEKEIGHVWADERRLKQMMVNLLSNAVKFTPAGGQLGLKARVDRKDMKLLLTIWDHGIGIRDEDLKRLFRPFVQLDSSLSRESAGTGLGLALVAEMARLHGGSVSVSSQPGQGSQFTINLPWDPAISTDTLDKLRISSKIPIMKRTTIEKQTILLVEDTESVVLLLRDYLELAGYKVEIARDGADGVSKSIALQPNLILMDVQMPGMDGLEATRRIRRVTSLKNTPIIALTALAMTSDRERCLEAGMDDYLSKPINLKELAKTVLKHLAGSGTGTKL